MNNTEAIEGAHEYSHARDCAAFTATTDGFQKPCDCRCQCSHSRGQHVQYGEGEPFVDCAVCDCEEFAQPRAAAIHRPVSDTQDVPPERTCLKRVERDGHMTWMECGGGDGEPEYVPASTAEGLAEALRGVLEIVNPSLVATSGAQERLTAARAALARWEGKA